LEEEEKLNTHLTVRVRLKTRREKEVVDVGEKERRYSGREGEEGGGERMCECERGRREKKRGGLDKECLSV
jgi:hypothetical protein